jgi:hypothetical protein
MDAVTEEREARAVRRLHRWHIHCFELLGFSHVDAELLELAHVDWHEAEALLAHGCPHETALLILI